MTWVESLLALLLAKLLLIFLISILVAVCSNHDNPEH